MRRFSRLRLFRARPRNRTRRRTLRYLLVILTVGMCAILLTGQGQSSNAEEVQATYQGKTIQWWAHRAVQARKDANKRGFTIHRLRSTVRHSVSIQESIRLATIVYPAFTEHRAWCIINHESGGDIHAQNKQGIRWPWNKATGLYQILPTTWRSTPFGAMSMYSPLAQSLAAGWMHQVGRGREWAINC